MVYTKFRWVLIFIFFASLAPSAIAAGLPFTQPTSFEQNAGQEPVSVRYLSRGHGATLFLTDSESVLSLLDGSVLRIGLRDAMLLERPIGEAELATKSHYLLGAFGQKPLTGVRHFSQVRYPAVYPGIDLVYRPAAVNGLEYDFEVNAGVDPHQIRMTFSGMQRMDLDDRGNLVFTFPDGTITHRAPVAFQHDDRGEKVVVPARYEIHEDNSIGFKLAGYDADRPLVIDPVIEMSTYIGDRGTTAKDIKVASDGSIYVYGYTAYTGFPVTPGAYQTSPAGLSDAFIAKITPDGAQYEFLTYLGGSSDESNGGSIGPQMALDGVGNIYVTGRTQSQDFPLLNPIQATMDGTQDFFVSKLSRDGASLLYSTYLGGPDNDGRSSEASPSIAIDAEGNAFIMGYTNADGYPTVNAQQDRLAGGLDPVITKIDARGTTILFSTYFGGTSDDKARGMAVDRSGNLFITGRSDSADFPLLNPIQARHAGQGDVFVSKFLGDGTLVFSTLWGGRNVEKGRAIALDNAGNVYVTGNTQSDNFPVVSPIQRSLAGSGDLFLMKIDAGLSRVLFSTYLGGSDEDLGAAIALDRFSNIYIGGYTKSSDFPTTSPFQAALSGSQDAIAVKINARGNRVFFASYLGGSADDETIAVGLDNARNMFILGNTTSLDFPLLNPLQSESGGVFLTKIRP